MRNKRIWPLYAGFAGLVLILYFGTSVISNKQRTLEKSRVMVKQSKSAQVLLRDAYHQLTDVQRAKIDELNVLMEKESDESRRLNLLESLAGQWYQWGFYDISGYHAEQIAEIRNSSDSWAIAGTTYMQGIRVSEDERTKSYCAEKARAAFDQAKLLQPDNPEVDLNRALTYVYLPESNNPMGGIMQLIQLKESYPDYAPVYRHLGILANQTGQYDKALERLRTAWTLEKDRSKVSCILVETFTALQMPDSARHYNKICKN